MCSIQPLQRTHSLPLSRTDPQQQPQQREVFGLRRRLSSLSLRIHPISSHPATSWAFQRSQSLSSIGEHARSSVRKWWDWGWSWILARKRRFARDLEMEDEETTRILGSQQHQKANWRHAFYKVRLEIRRLTGSNRVGLPQTCRYDSFDYSKNFDDGER